MQTVVPGPRVLYQRYMAKVCRSVLKLHIALHMFSINRMCFMLILVLRGYYTGIVHPRDRLSHPRIVLEGYNVMGHRHSSSCGAENMFRLICLGQRFPNFLGCGPLLLLNIFRGAHVGLANTKDI